jgi:hypothetical protein
MAAMRKKSTTERKQRKKQSEQFVPRVLRLVVIGFSEKYALMLC